MISFFLNSGSIAIIISLIQYILMINKYQEDYIKILGYLLLYNQNNFLIYNQMAQNGHEKNFKQNLNACYKNIGNKFTIIIYHYNINLLQRLLMNQRRAKQRQTPSLAQIMRNWRGQSIVLRANHGQLTLVENNYHISQRRRSEADPIQMGDSRFGFGLFSRLARVNTHNQSQGNNCAIDNRLKLNSYKSQQQFVLRAANKSAHHRVSLADLGQIYNAKKFSNQKLPKKPRVSQNFIANQNNQNYNSNKPLNYAQPNQTHSKYYKENSNFIRKPLRNIQNTNMINPVHEKRHLNNNHQQNKPYLSHRKQALNSKELQQIKQSINQIKLPNYQQACPEYDKASERFEKMKGQILHKIIAAGEVNQIDSILRQIRQAADDIIVRHCPKPALSLKKHGIFSFNQNQYPVQNTIIEPAMKQIDEQIQNKEQVVALPQFKDDGGNGSISSISSLNDQNKKDTSKDEDICKIQNIFINQQINNFSQSNQTSNSIKPITLNGLNKKQDSGEQKIIHQAKIEQQAIEMSLRVKDTISHPNLFYNAIKTDQIKNVPIPELTFEKKIQSIEPVHQSFKKKDNCSQAYGTGNYQLQKITNEPVKIISNLEEAKQFDPEVVKFTELKIKILETRTTAPEIIKIPSPLRFRRKQEVVKCLVANHIVDKESASIQF